jgi:septum formation protein
VKIILASASPRRSQLLEQIGLNFIVHPSQVEEKYIEGQKPHIWVQNVALAKALDVANSLKEGIVIGADTIVVNENYILGKPKDEAEAQLMLKSLSGKKHQVLTGFAIVDGTNTDNYFTQVEITNVKFRSLREKEIKAYVRSKEPLDKAGAYGIQGLGALLIEEIEGCYFNVVGLPLSKIALGLEKFGVEVWK